MDLYLLAGEANAPPPDVIERRLVEIGTSIAETGSVAGRESFERLSGLIRRKLGQPVSASATPDRANLAAAPARRVMVSGIGRSGTTLIFQQLAKLFQVEGLATNYRYEPYLWNICTPGTKGNSFGIGQLSTIGIHTHINTPLILRQPTDLHDRFIDSLFGGALDSDPTRFPDAYLTKVIRGSGRLRSYLDRYPDLKIVACLRNPLDTINSGLGMFSFFGEEFHADDRARFKAEIADRPDLTARLVDGRNSIEWFAAWWRVFTEETLSVIRDFPDRVMAFCYESFQEDGPGLLSALQDFVGLRNDGMQIGLGRPAGPSIKSTSLTTHDLFRLREDVEFYRDMVLQPNLGAEKAFARSAKLVTRYTEGVFTFPIAGSELGQRAPIQLRGMMLSSAPPTDFQLLARGPRHPLNLSTLVAAHAGATPAGVLRAPVSDIAAAKHGKTYGVIVTCHNNETTITDAVLSCLNQTLPYDEIVVVDDKSKDGSLARLRELERLYTSVRVIALESNLGPSAARDLGIRRLRTDFFTQLDGDDLFWPTKNAAEAAALAGDETAVAFSDILLVTKDNATVQSTAVYHAEGRSEVFPRLLARTRQIPRDMTLSRQKYLQAGGYELVSSLYEDWDFKLRLAALGGPWRRSESIAGTIYNRLAPGLSGVSDGQHARALSLIFLRAMALAPVSAEALPAAFDAAVGRFADRHICRRARALLDAAADRGDALAGISRLLSSRAIQSMENVDVAALIDLETGKLSKQGAAA